MKKGFTLIELVVIMALFSVVMLVGMSFLIGSKNSFQRSQDASEIHYEVRKASDYIRDEIRNADFIEIGLIPSTPDPFFDYLYVSSGQLIHVVNGVAYTKTLDILIDDANMFLIEQALNGNNAITYTIDASLSSSVGTRTYNAPTTIHLNNITDYLGKRGNTYTAVSGPCIKYTKP
ncbi:MAG: type II secretion system protein [Clostridia bacterium]|nr:type II secretion system protein [Clostridia bacterium]